MLRGTISGAAAILFAVLGPLAVTAVTGCGVLSCALAGQAEGRLLQAGARAGKEPKRERRKVLFGEAGAEPDFLEKTITRYHANELWMGAALSSFGWSIYSGVTMAPFGLDGVQADGWRLRVTSSVNGRGNPANILQLPGVTSTTNLMVGYHLSWGAATIKAFIGGSLNGRAIAQYTTGVEDLGGEAGAIGALETWLNISPYVFLSLDASYSDLNASYSFASRLGYRWSPIVSIGPEVAVYGSGDGRGGRLGLFARLEWDFGEISVAGGVLDKQLGYSRARGSSKSASKTAYGSLTWVHRY